MALGEDMFDQKILGFVQSIENDVTTHPAFQDFRDKLLNYLESNAETLATYTPEQLISEARSLEELIAMKDWLQKRYGNEQAWWDFYHVRRRELALAPSYYGNNSYGLPTSVRIFNRGWGQGAQSEAVQRNIFSKKFSFEQLTGKSQLWSAGRGNIPIEFKQGLDFKPPTPVQRYMAFDLETTGLLKDLARKTTGPQRGIYSAGWVTENGPEPGNFMQRILPSRTGGGRPFFGHYIETEIIPRGDRVAQALRGTGKLFQTESEREIVERFIGAVAGQPKSRALLGYNIEKFDLPFMHLMAERHGMSDAWKAAIEGRQRIDVARPVQAFLSKQLAGKYVGWQESMIGEMGMQPRGWKLEAIAEAFGFEPKDPIGSIAHTPVTDAEMSVFVHETLQDEKKATEIWKKGGEARYHKFLASKGDSLIPLSDFEKMVEVRDGGVFLKPQAGVLPPSAFDDEVILARLAKKYGAGTYAAKARTETFENTARAISKTTRAGLGHAFTGAKYLGGAALLGMVLPGEGISNLIGGVAAIAGWKAAGLGLSKAGATGGTPYKLLAGALAYAGVKGLSMLGDPGHPVAQASEQYQGTIAEEEAKTNESFLMPQLSGSPPPETQEETPAGFNVLKAHDILGIIEKDRKVSQQETEALAALTTVGAQNNAVLQTVSAKDASSVFKSGISWRDQAHAGQITTTLQEPNQLGEFGSYNPSSNTLAVNALIDPRDFGAWLGMAHKTSDKNLERRVVEEGSWMTSPSKMSETTLHEGLHAVWDTDIDTAHKRAYVEAATRELEEGSGPNIDALAAKHPIYAQQIERAKGNFIFGINEEARDWVANEMFAHRGAAMRYNAGYNLGKDSALDTIAASYVKWGKKKQGGMPVFTGTDVDAALSSGGLTPAAYAHYASTSRLRVTPDGTGLQFSGLSTGGGAEGTRRTRTDFGSPWQGPKITGPIAAAIAAAGILATGATAAALSSSSDLRGRTRVHGQDIDPKIMAFREEWVKDKKKRAELEKMREEAYPKPGDLEPWRLQAIGKDNKLARLNTEGLTPVWDDADTLTLKYPWYKFWKSDISVRLSGIDAPEVLHEMPLEWSRWQETQPHGEKSKQELEEMTRGKALDIVIAADPKQRSYGRYLGAVHREGSDLPLNIELIQKGLAAALPWGESGSDIFPRETLIQAEREAYAAKEGMWQEPYWQRYQDISQGARRRITFTSFTNLERLSENLNLAAAEALMRSEDVKYEPWMGRYIGTKLRSFFGGKGKGKEKEGIHPGAPDGSLGTKSIRQHSSFGSKFDAAREFVRSSSFFKGLDEAAALLKLRKSTEFKRLLETGKKVKDLGHGQFGKAELMETVLPGTSKPFRYVRKTEFDYDQLGPIAKKMKDKGTWVPGFQAEEEAMRLLEEGETVATPYLNTGKELYMEAMPGKTPVSTVLHPVTGEEVHVLRRPLKDKELGSILGEIQNAADKGFWNPDVHGKNILVDEASGRVSWLDFGSARAKQTQEGKYLSALGAVEISEVGQKIKTLRGTEKLTKEDLAAVLRRAGWKNVPDDIPVDDVFASTPPPPLKRPNLIGRMKEAIWKAKLEAAYRGVKFPGMPDEGFASRIRERLTEFKKNFASRWDPMRKLAVKLFGKKYLGLFGKRTEEEAFQKMISSKGFKKVVASALEGEGASLGEGASSFVKKYTGTYKGHKFDFLGKEFKEGKDIAYHAGSPEAADFGGRDVLFEELFQGREDIANAYRAGMVGAETNALQKLGHSRAPSFYGTAGSVGAKNKKKDVILMEMFKDAKEIGEGGKISRKEAGELVGFMDEAHAEDIFHLDMHGGNVMRVAGEGEKSEIAVIDWAMSNRMQDPRREGWVWDLASADSGWKDLGGTRGITEEVITERRRGIQQAIFSMGMGKEGVDTAVLSRHIDLSRINMLEMDPALRNTVLSSGETVADSLGGEFFNEMTQMKLTSSNIVSRTRGILQSSRDAMETAAAFAGGRSTIQNSVTIANTVPSGQAAAALRAQEKKFPSVAVPWKAAQNAGHRHARSMSKRSGG